jgi:type IV secretory pathway TraG/TraD family ATPase VirD4
MSFLGFYRDPVVATVTRQCDWRIRDLVEGVAPAALYLVVPPSHISRTKPLVRLILNQIGRRLTEELEAKRRRHRLLLMLDEFPALGRLDFFESALAFMAGYGLKSFLIAQSLNQIEKAYGQNNSILDNSNGGGRVEGRRGAPAAHRYSKVSLVAEGVICGLGPEGYLLALRAVASRVKDTTSGR